MLDFSIRNNVKATLAAGVGVSDTVIAVNPANAPYNSPLSYGGYKSRFTIVDNEAAPTKIEIIETSTASTVDGFGIISLNGVTRGMEGTTAYAWGGGAVIFQSITADVARGGTFGLYSQFVDTPIEDDWGHAHRYFVKSQDDTLITRATEDVRLDIDADWIGGKNIYGAMILVGVSLMTNPDSSANMQGLTTTHKLCIAGSIPLSSSSVIDRAGVIRVDANYIYVSVGVNNWKRVALSAF